MSEHKTFNYLILSIKLRAIESISLPRIAGATLRGGFGYAFKDIACGYSGKKCSECPIFENCAYHYIFETPRPSDAEMMKLYPQVPHPFVIDSHLIKKNEYKPDEIFCFNLVLIGNATGYIPFFILAFEELGKRGLGIKKGKFRIDHVEIESEDKEQKILLYKDNILKKPDKVRNFDFDNLNDLSKHYLDCDNRNEASMTLDFLTPTLIMYQERGVNPPEFHHLIRNILRRFSALAYFHCGMNLNDVDYKTIIEHASKVRLKKSDTTWSENRRFSTRQNQSYDLMGFTGTVQYYANNLKRFIPLIQLFSDLHVGKHATFSQGKYILKSHDKGDQP